MAASTTATDPNVKVPAAVKAAADLANAAHLAHYPAATPPVVGPPADPAAAAPTGAPSGTPPVTPAGNAPPADSWEHRYNSSQGRLAQRDASIKAMAEQITSLQGVLATVGTAPAPAPAARTPTKLVTAEEEAVYGEDFLGVVGKRAREETFGQISELLQKVDDLTLQVGKNNLAVAGDARARMLAAMDTSLPDWRVINDDANFFQWLQLPDPYSGAIRHELLKTAFGQNNAPRVLVFFNGFLAEEAATAPAVVVPGVKPPLETFAAPGRARSAAGQEPPAEKPIITRQDVATFYADVARGKYRGRDELKADHEAQIFAATRDGRLR